MNRPMLATSVALLLLHAHSQADVVYTEDLIVQGSLCAGNDCADPETFAFDVLRLKGDDPVLRFEDTSDTGSFPAQDWLMGVTNDALTLPQLFIRRDDTGAPLLILESGSDAGVAIGEGAALESGAVSVGDSGSERRIMHVADGVDPSDAATLGQMDAAVDVLRADVAAELAADRAEIDAQISATQDEIDALTARLDALETTLGI
ncbi:hypothetical protein E4634_10585 [Mangrovimicrobium sediminis]|uniref:Uncharacterized protein n=1 Tax=Mangrovimicrobium sediminis TaxID=2562682 RepID=A0A4Z0M267_9GAMM|nr:hypothetical protein [Haliea sp. SAOS-164]TGD73468.1 hypothetical protein E4634_10585 [Haliea sp. SAOS-164]